MGFDRNDLRHRMALALSCALGSCAPETPDLPTFEVVDSAGATVVTSHTPQGFDTPWALTPEPTVRIGKGRQEEPYLFGSVGGAARLSDGSIVVLDRSSYELRRFGADGRHLLSFGGMGDGPGEFRGLMWLQRTGDTLVVFDRGGRVTRFDPTGRVLDVIPAGGLAAGDGSTPGDWGGVLPNGALWGSRYPEPAVPPEGSHRPRSVLVMSDVDRSEVRRVTDYPGFSQFQSSDGAAWGSLPQFFTAIVPSREPIGLLVGDNETFTIDLFDREGALVRRMRYPAGVSGDVEGRAAAERRDALRGFEDLAERRPRFDLAAYRRWLEELPTPASWPGFSVLESDVEGYVWALEYRTTDVVGYAATSESAEPRAALVFHPDGYLLGAVDLPSRLITWEIGTDYVLGVEVDELGVTEVVLYGLSGR